MRASLSAAAWRLAVFGFVNSRACVHAPNCELPSLHVLTCRRMCACSLPHIVPQKYFDMYPDVGQISLPPNPNVPQNFPREAWSPSGIAAIIVLSSPDRHTSSMTLDTLKADEVHVFWHGR